MSTKSSIKDYLVKSGNYHSTDDILINEILFNIQLMNDAKLEIQNNGFQLNITKNEKKQDFYQKSRAVDVYQQALRNVQGIMKQLILTPSDRQKLKIELMSKTDDFEAAFGK